MNNFFQKIWQVSIGNKRISIPVLAFLLAGIFLAVFPVNAGGVSESVTVVIGAYTFLIIKFLGFVMTLLMSVIAGVAQYNDFSNSQAIIYGWVIIRDLCNIFFILILLVIAFAVILRVEGYNIKSMVPKLLILAVLINFSRIICGLLIDAGQIVMLAFVSSFKDATGGNIAQMLGISSFLKFDTGKDAAGVADIAGVATASILAVVFLLITIVVLCVILAVLVMRIVMLWIYVTLSPLAYFLAAFPQGKGYAQKWWKEFTEYIIIGPFLAFFLWLSFVSLGNVKSGSEILNVAGADAGAPAGLTEAGSFGHVVKFAIGIGMLIGGLILSQGLAGAAGKFAGAGMAKITGSASWLKKKGQKALRRTATRAGAVGLAAAGAGLTKVPMLSKIDSLQKAGTVAQKWSGNLNKGLAKEKTADRVKLFKKLGMGEDTQKALGEFADTRLGRSAKTAAFIAGGAVAAPLTLGASMVPAAIAAAYHGVPTMLAGRRKKGEAGLEMVKNARKGGLDVAQNDKNAKVGQIERLNVLDAEQKKVGTDFTSGKIARAEYDEKTNKIKDERTNIETNLVNSGVIKDKAEVADKAGRDNVIKGKIEVEFNAEKNKIENEYRSKLAARAGDKNEQQVRKGEKMIKINNLKSDIDAEKRNIELIKNSPWTKDKKEKDIAAAKQRIAGKKKEIEGVESDYRKESGTWVAGGYKKSKLEEQKNKDIEAIKNNPLMGQPQKDREIKDIEANYQKKMKDVESGWWAKKIKDYHPNKVTMAAVKEGQKNSEVPKQRVRAIAGGADAAEMDAGTWYSEEGQKDAQANMFKELTSGTTEAAQAMQRMASSFGELLRKQQSGIKLSEGQLKKIAGFKKGAAAFEKGGGNLAPMTAVIDIANQIQNADGNTETVSDLKEKVIENK